MFVVDAALERGLEPPSWWQEKPELSLLEERMLSMYFDVGTCRVSGTSPVPWVVAKEYAEYHQIDFKFFWQMVSALDSEYLDYQSKQFEERMKK